MTEAATDPFENVRKMVAVTEDRLLAADARFSDISARLYRQMAEQPGSERSYREALSQEYGHVVRLREELAYWRTKLPPFAEARDGYIMLLPVTPENAHLLANPPGKPSQSQPLPS